jgi:hypothetical protein
VTELRKRATVKPQPEPQPDRGGKYRPYNRCPVCGVSVPKVETGDGQRGRYCSVEHRRLGLTRIRAAEIRDAALAKVKPNRSMLEGAASALKKGQGARWQAVSSEWSRVIHRFAGYTLSR